MSEPLHRMMVDHLRKIRDIDDAGDVYTNRIVEGRETFYLVRELLNRSLIRYVSSGHGMRITDAGRRFLYENGD